MGGRRRTAAVVAGLAAALAALAVWSRREIRRGEEAYAPAGEIVDCGDGAHLHVVEAGEGPPLVLIHGADGAMQGFTETVFDELSREHHAVAVDRPGHGWSSAEPGAVHDVGLNVRLIREAIRRLGIERPVLVGHSYGAAVALRWALDHPGEVAGLVLLAPAAYFPWRAPLWLLRAPRIPLVGPALTRALLVPVGRLVLKPLDRNAFAPCPVPDAYDAYSRALFLRPSQFQALCEEYRALPGDVGAVASRYESLDVPTLIIAGEDDHVTRTPLHAQRLAAEVPSAELVLLPETGHELQWDHPEAVLDAVRRVVSRAGESDT